MTKKKDITEDTTQPVDALDFGFAHTALHSPIDIALHEWAEAGERNSGPGATFTLNGKPVHPLAPEIAALLEKWTHSDLVDVREVRLLGEGGMAQVFLGTQQVPPRHVAVKRLRGNTLELAEQLFSEALLTGSLEHPNIIPVHSIKIDPERGPEVVLKRVEGESLEQAFLRIGQTEAGLKELLAKLLQVCNALEYAHSKGILHRDIKPENIMLGSFGEVYLLDWGIAIDTQSQEKPNEGVVGTPHYIAPEMLSGDPSTVDVRTDVYLLGATLHFLLVGKPRHDAPTALAAAILASESKGFDYPSEVFEGLGEIANRACHLSPSERPQSVKEFRQLIEVALVHWQALKTVQLARPDYDFVMGALGGANIEVLAERYEAAVRQLQQALASWEECSLAQEQLTALRLKMARVYAEAGQSDASENVLRTIEAESERDKLQIKQIHSLNSTTERRVAEVFETAAANDMSASSVGRRRAAGAMLFVVVASVLASTIHQTMTGQLRDARDGLLIWLLGLGIVLSVLFLNRKTFMGNKAGRRAILVIMFAPLLIASIRIVAYFHNLNPLMIHPIETFAVAHVCATAVEVFPQGPKFAGVIALLGIGGLVFPQLSYLLFVIALVGACIGFVWQWLVKNDSAPAVTEGDN